MAGAVPPRTRVRERREELIRSGDRARDFTSREAQRNLLRKERPRWHLIAYAVVLAAALIIFSVAYTTYAFSKYRGVILPGVHVDNTSLAGLTEGQARNLLWTKLAAIGDVPVRLTHGSKQWTPKQGNIGVNWRVDDTVKNAMAVGRQETFLVQLLDRLPLHPTHSVPLLYNLNDRLLQAYITNQVAPRIVRPRKDARLKIHQDHVVLIHNQPGLQLDINATDREVRAALGSLTKQSEPVPLKQIPPVITDAYASRIRDRIEAFLSDPPVIGIGKLVVPMTRADIAPMLHFRRRYGKNQAQIVMDVSPNAVSQYVASLAARVDRAPQNPKLSFAGETVQVITPRRLGRSMDQGVATQKLLKAVAALKPRARLRFKVKVVPPPIDLSNPASVGINTVLAAGQSSFVGAGDTRLQDVMAIAAKLNNVLIAPNQDISFNQTVLTDWPSRVYDDAEIVKHGEMVPGPGGAMQQVATTFLRALFSAGLTLEERHSHVYRLPWYEPPAGEDAIVSPDGMDLRFHNNTGKYLLLGTRVEPIRQELYVYVYGPKLKWSVSVDRLGKIKKVYPHGPPVVKQDPSLQPGQTQQIAYAHDGADTVVQRTITYPNGNVRVDQLFTHYKPWRAEVLTGGSTATATPTSKKATPTVTGTGTVTATVTATPGPTPTATFNH